MSRIFPLALCFALIGLILPVFGAVQIQSQKIYVDGQEFYVKGMVYEPAPLGIANMNYEGYGGGGLCSAKLTPYDEWKSACYDYDFYDGSGPSKGRVPDGPSTWFSALWSRDLPVLKDLGVNTIRIYSMNPLTEAASEAAVGQDGIVHPYGKSHVEFMDACHAQGIKVMAPLVSSNPNVLMDDEEKIWKGKVSNLVSEIGSHPALLAFIVGSDWGLESEPSLTSRVNEVIAHARSAGAQVPMTYCTSNLPDTAQYYADNLDIDFLCANIGWDGPSGISSFIGDTSDGNSWASKTKEKGWPIVIGEAGMADLNSSSTSDQATWFNELWKQTLDYDASGVVGSIYYEYNDEPYSSKTWLRTLGATYFTVSIDGISNSTQENVFWADDVNQKPGLYSAIKAGKLGSQDMNYNMDVYQYFGRSSTNSHANTPSSANNNLPKVFTLLVALAGLAILVI